MHLGVPETLVIPAIIHANDGSSRRWIVSRMNKLINSVGFKPAIAGAMLLAATSWASAQSSTFAQVTENEPVSAGNLFAYVNNGPTGDAELTTDSGGVLGAPISVDFTFLNGLGGPLAGVRPVAATLTLTSSTLSGAQTAFGGMVAAQPITGAGGAPDVLKITLVTPVGGLSNLLTLTNFTGSLIGAIGGSTPQIYGDTELGNTVGYSSDFVSFTNANREDFSVALSSWIPSVAPAGLQVATDGYYSAATASAAGTFDFSATVPEPSSTALALGALAVFVGFGRQSRHLTWGRA
jgi:hypothetical protein